MTLFSSDKCVLDGCHAALALGDFARTALPPQIRFW